ncbi:MAG TPA: ribonuclease J [Candidatus Binataceae bacterium]|nr:ribonuclease J [Candidatus Binataceae bacterium]
MPVRIVPLGGFGEIGLNLTVVECAGQALIIDAGVMFPEERGLGLGVLAPDLTYLEQSRPQVLGIVLTHAHEDHIGALPHLLRRFNAPVYGTKLTLAFARRRLEEEGLIGARMNALEPRRSFELGPFELEPLRVTHSTPDSVGLAIRTPAGLIVHSGDFKIDPAPIDGQLFDRERFAELGAEGAALLISDSTNVERTGRTASESSIKPVLREIVARSRGRFFLSVFSSHLHRIRQLTEVSREAGRRVVPLGRRMAESVRLGTELGQLPFPPGTFIEPGEAQFLEARRLTYLASGSQGESLSALARIAAGAHPRARVDPGDTVVLSSRFIPGNERTINTLVNRLYKRGAEVFYEAVAPVHVSGHASRDELAELIALVRPRHFVPTHGEYRHLRRHLALAVEAGIPEANCFLLENGEPLVLNGAGAHRARAVEAGRVLIEDGEFGDPALLDERRALGRDGTVFAVLAVSSKSGALVAGPELVSRGIVVGDGTSVHMRRARAQLVERLNRIEQPFSADGAMLREEIVHALRSYFSHALGKRPLIVPHIMEV